MTDRSKVGLSEERILRNISAAPIPVSVEEAQHEANTMTGEDYDEWFFRALHERESEHICAGYGGIQHPTSRLFEIGVDSIRAGKPSELFLTLLEEIGKMAEERDVMSELFPGTFRRRIKTTTILAAKREAKIVAEFKEHVRRYLKSLKEAKVVGDEDKGGSWRWVERTYAKAIAEYKQGMDLHEQKAFDRALKNQGAAIIEWRDHMIETRKLHRPS